MNKFRWSVFIFLVGATAVKGQANELEGVLTFNCPVASAPFSVQSQYFPQVLDRIWNFQCAQTPGIWNRCFNTTAVHFINKTRGISPYEAPQTGLQCDGGILSGAQSTFDPTTRDRAWTYRCCFSTSFVTTRCRSTSPSEFNQSFNFEAPFPSIINGMIGIYNPFARDRRWYFSVCDIAARAPLGLV